MGSGSTETLMPVLGSPTPWLGSTKARPWSTYAEPKSTDIVLGTSILMLGSLALELGSIKAAAWDTSARGMCKGNGVLSLGTEVLSPTLMEPVVGDLGTGTSVPSPVSVDSGIGVPWSSFAD